MLCCQLYRKDLVKTTFAVCIYHYQNISNLKTVKIHHLFYCYVHDRGVRGWVWAGFGQTQYPNHIGYSGLGEVKYPPVILMGGFG